MAAFGSRLRELRKRRNLRQSDLGEHLHVGKSAVSQWENDMRIPDPRTLERLADLFGVSMDYLLGRTDEAGVPNSVKRMEEGGPESKLITDDTKHSRKHDDDTELRGDGSMAVRKALLSVLPAPSTPERT